MSSPRLSQYSTQYSSPYSNPKQKTAVVNTVSQCQPLMYLFIYWIPHLISTSLFTGSITKVKDTLTTQNDQKDDHILNVSVSVSFTSIKYPFSNLNVSAFFVLTSDMEVPCCLSSFIKCRKVGLDSVHFFFWIWTLKKNKKTIYNILIMYY